MLQHMKENAAQLNTWAQEQITSGNANMVIAGSPNQQTFYAGHGAANVRANM
jgi:hypothetical protein